MTVEAIDFYLILLFGIGFIHKWWVERAILRVSERLTPPERRSPLGNAFRAKTRSLSWLMFCLGIVFLMRGIPYWGEPREVVLALRAVAFVLFIWNQYWCHRMRIELNRKLDYISTRRELGSA